jgi:hypothetical protein
MNLCDIFAAGCRVGEPRDVLPQLVDFAMSLGRPVASGLLSTAHAEAAIVTQCLAAAKNGELGDLEIAPLTIAQVLQWILRDLAGKPHPRTDTARAEILWQLQPMIARRENSNKLLEKAHAINEAREFEMADWEVEETVATLCFIALHQQRRERTRPEADAKKRRNPC